MANNKNYGLQILISPKSPLKPYISNKITSGKMGFIIWNNIWKYALPPIRLSNKDYANFHPKKGLKEVKGSLHGACYLQ